MKRYASMAFTLAMVAFFYLAIKISDLHFVVPESESVAGNLFLLQNKNTSNDYVVFEYDKAPYKNYQKGKLFIKKIGCDSGQHLDIQNNKIFCNDKLIAVALDKNREGEILNKIDFTGTIPQDEFFALGEHPMSYDSRYFGLVNKKDVKNTARRIF